MQRMRWGDGQAFIVTVSSATPIKVVVQDEHLQGSCSKQFGPSDRTLSMATGPAKPCSKSASVLTSTAPVPWT